VCPQLDANMSFVGSEDCLTLNVWTPSAAPAQPLPVLVFLHGGGNTQGSSSATSNGVYLYDGEHVAEKGDVVVVTLNYRLGVLGFFAHTSLDAESADQVSGNYGILDQIAALGWVKRNISAFGGDPARVLVFGESAGAVDTCVQVASPLSAGLFSAALMESGGCGAPTLAQTETQDQPLVQMAGCDPSGDVTSCLRALPAEDLVTRLPGVVSVSGLDKGVKYGPNVDGHVLVDTPLKTLLAGKHNRVPFIVGSNADETSRYVPAVPDATTYASLVHQEFGAALGDQILARYPASAFPSPRAAFVAVTTDARFVCPARTIARAARGAQAEPVRRYFFSHALDSTAAKSYGAWHGLELLWVFQHLDVAGYVPSAAEVGLSDAMIGYWSRFAAAGDPDGPGAIAWPAYDAATDATLELDDTIAGLDGVRTARCDFWDSLL
jgi:para-nitrobenzyl esterase